MSTDRAPETPRTDAAVQPNRLYKPSYDITPRYEMPLVPVSGAVQLHDESDPVVWVPDAYGRMIPMRRSAAPGPMQPMPPRDLSPQPLLDPRAQMIAAGGVLAAGTGWGIGQALAPLAGVGAGGLMWIALAVVGWKLAPSLTRGGGTVERHEHHTHVTNTNRGFGRSTTNVNH
ncbi:hypothetical protein OG413_46730 [Streptomyces sp. NBC_01433]|uniref:hypothetical protein n=1 Tax=Streptomyces sp. NBC_01433 TaxID=2903864 RepID=UPI0022596434|nr:hypothetical protein [Streptomyces sp. NBC_01433]MCX4682645.1 hypothetical protein [Streptomyces sp. NBC_01433]MCX4682685.1 hypothetical protein [Streptomyces sp. NBC_01433]